MPHSNVVSILIASCVILSQILERRFLPFLFFEPSSLPPQLQSSLKTPKDLEHANLFSITSLKFLLVCTLHIPLHKELHWHKFLSAGTTTSCYASTHLKHISEQQTKHFLSLWSYQKVPLIPRLFIFLPVHSHKQ